MTITIKSKYNKGGNKYWFAINEENQIFGSTFNFANNFYDSELFLSYEFKSLELLKQAIENWKKWKEEAETIETCNR